MPRTFPEIIASGLNTLDQARYFAAMGVDWLGFDLQKITVEDLKAINEWVVGPKLFVEIENMTEDMLFELTQKIPVDGIHVSADMALPGWYAGRQILAVHDAKGLVTASHVPQSTLYISHSDLYSLSKALQPLTNEHSIWVEYELNNIELAHRDAQKWYGIAVKCRIRPDDDSPFDPYDNFFETIRELSE